jgi:signal transduction histidine kinase
VNLVSNAIKFTEIGVVLVSVLYKEDQHHFAVKDTGPGIPKATQLRIFEPFEQGEPSRKKHGIGLGLGLALVREMTDSLKGTVELVSEVGVGSTFTVSLPSLAKAEEC